MNAEPYGEDLLVVAANSFSYFGYDDQDCFLLRTTGLGIPAVGTKAHTSLKSM
jgi:hypothetical protein